MDVASDMIPMNQLKRGYNIIGYDYYRPYYPEGKFDTIICNYVLNVLEPYAQAEVLMNVTNLLSSNGTAFLPSSARLGRRRFPTSCHLQTVHLSM